ncbi:MAG TPA: ABC transporter permease [Thermotogota bacterium]|nr:ABC transporter permease [Thermotogota bacterium]HRW92740.1 ABC transporter permease [Thermotogota bacterium]
MKGETRKLVKKFFHNPLNAISLCVLGLFVIVALFPGLVAPYDPLKMDGEYFMSSPVGAHWFGTDQFGRDILSRIVFGVQNSMMIAVLAVLLAAALGTFLGVIAGYFGKIVDGVIMRVVDAMFAFPALILALFIIALFGASVPNLVVAIGIVYTPIFARTMRGSTISVKQNLYVVSAKALGKSHLGVIFREILPNISSILIVTFTTNFSTALLSEASLGFLGLGVPPPTPTLGGLVGEGSRFLLAAPWIALFPGGIIALIVLSINIIGDGLRDTLDPRTGK